MYTVISNVIVRNLTL